MSRVGRKIAAAALGLALVGGCVKGCQSYFQEKTYLTAITETSVKRYGKSDKYLVFTPAEVFENTDNGLVGKWNSSDIQERIMQLKGRKVRIRAIGWRAHPLSWYKNIVGVEEVRE